MNISCVFFVAGTFHLKYNNKYEKDSVCGEGGGKLRPRCQLLQQEKYQPQQNQPSFQPKYQQYFQTADEQKTCECYETVDILENGDENIGGYS